MKFQELKQSQVLEIERTCLVKSDFRSDLKRQTIYQVLEHKQYVLIEKIKGEYTKIVQAQNVLILLLKHVN